VSLIKIFNTHSISILFQLTLTVNFSLYNSKRLAKIAALVFCLCFLLDSVCDKVSSAIPIILRKMETQKQSKQSKKSAPVVAEVSPQPAAKFPEVVENDLRNGHSKSVTPEPQGRDTRSMTPTRLSRLDEKNVLISLNDRLAHIIDKNKQLEAENSTLNAKIETAEQRHEVSTTKLKAVFDDRYKELQDALDKAENEKEKLLISEKNLKDDLGDANSQIKKKDKDISDLEKKLKDTEKKLSKTEGDLKKEKDENKGLEKKIKDIENENKKLEEEVKDLKKKLDDALLDKAELANKLKNKDDDLKRKEIVYEQEVESIKSTNHYRIQEIGGKLQQEYEAKLAEAIKQLRDDCNCVIDQNKEDQDKLYKIKEQDFKNELDSIKNDLKTKNNETSSLLKKIDEAEKKLTALDGEKHTLEQRLKAANDKLNDTQNKLNNSIKDLNKKNKDLQDEKKNIIQEYIDLMDVKVALDKEIQTYRNLLEGEEERLNLTPEPIKV